MVRLPLPDSAAVVAEAPHLFDSLAIDDLHAARAIGNNPELLAGVLEYMSVLYADLSMADRELVILATARTLESRYEWQQHVGVAADAGLSLEVIRAIGSDEFEHESLTERQRALLAFVRRQCLGTQSDESHERLAQFYEPAEIASIGLLTGHYTGIAGFLESMDIPLEEPFVGWEPSERNL